MPFISEETRKVYKIIHEKLDSGSNAPTIDELGKSLKLSTRKVLNSLRELEDALIIKRSPYRSRSIEIITPIDLETGKAEDTCIDVPILGTAPGGPALLATQNIEDYIPVPIRLLKGKREVFILRVTGKSMSPYLEDGDLAIIKAQHHANLRDIIVAAMPGPTSEYEATIKEYYYDDEHVILNPINKDYEPIILKKGGIEIQGVVIGAIKLFND